MKNQLSQLIAPTQGPKVIGYEKPIAGLVTYKIERHVPQRVVEETYPPIVEGPTIHPELLKQAAQVSVAGEMIKVLTVVDWLDHKMPGWDKDPCHIYVEETKQLRSWCEYHKVAYYAAPSEDFNYYEAARQARREGRRYVMVEDMS